MSESTSNNLETNEPYWLIEIPLTPPPSRSNYAYQCPPPFGRQVSKNVCYSQDKSYGNISRLWIQTTKINNKSAQTEQSAFFEEGYKWKPPHKAHGALGTCDM